jgi:hypothetical protein
LYDRFAEKPPRQPGEYWMEDDKAYLAYDLQPDAANTWPPPVALFVVEANLNKLLLVRVVTPESDLTQASVEDLYIYSKEVGEDEVK